MIFFLAGIYFFFFILAVYVTRSPSPINFRPISARRTSVSLTNLAMFYIRPIKSVIFFDIASSKRQQNADHLTDGSLHNVRSPVLTPCSQVKSHKCSLLSGSLGDVYLLYFWHNDNSMCACSVQLRINLISRTKLNTHTPGTSPVVKTSHLDPYG